MASWEISEDGLTYTFHIFEDANWSNGAQVTADDFVYGWRRLADPETGSEYAFILDTIHVVNAAEVHAGELPLEELGVEAPDSKTFIVHLSLPCDFMLGLLANPVLFPLNQEFFEAQGDQYALSIDNLLFNGEYLMTGWDEGTAYTFTKNPDYVHADDFTNETLVYRILLETQTSILEYQQDKVNLVPMNGEMVDMYKEEEGFHNRLEGTMWYLIPMLEDEIMANADFREFLAYAVDGNAIGESVLKDGSIKADGFIGHSFAFDENGVDFRDTAGTLTEYNPEKAKEAFDRAREALGDTITINLYYEDSDSAKNVAENLQQMLLGAAGEGLEVTMTCKPKKTRVQDLLNHNFQLMLTRWGPDYADPQIFLDMFVTGNEMNSSLYSSEKNDELIIRGTRGEDASDSAARWQDMIDAERVLIAEDHALIPVYQQGSALMITPGCEGYLFLSAASGVYRHLHWAE